MMGDISGRARSAGRRQQTHRRIKALMRAGEQQTETKQCQLSEGKAGGVTGCVWDEKLNLLKI